MFSNNITIVKQMVQIIERIFEYTNEYENADDLAADYKTYDATLMNFVALGELIGKLTDDFRNKHNNIEWPKIYAFRNIIAHDYFGIDEEEVLGIIKKHMPKLKENLCALTNKSNI